jgi:hypothetical protein
MALSTTVKNWINRGLGRAHLRLDTLTLESMELTRLSALFRRGYFDTPAFPVLDAFRECDPRPIVDDIVRHRERLRDFASAEGNPAGYAFDNPYFGSPDAEVLYAIARRYEPPRVLEVGCGNSTKLFRTAIADGGFECRLVSLDPSPRLEIGALSDEVHRMPAEDPAAQPLFSALRPGDLLFIDSSHIVAAGNDVVHLFLNVLPSLPEGVLVHVHDVFLPYDYPYDWVSEHRLVFGEQYLVQLMLAGGRRWDVLWPGYYLQRTVPDFGRWFEHVGTRRAQSLWLRTGAHREPHGRAVR